MTGDSDSIDSALFPNGLPSSDADIQRTLELYKLMVTSSENLVARRQGVNTFFLTINGAILTAAGLLIGNQSDIHLQAIGLSVLAITGAILALAWRSLIRSFGQLNAGKFAVINRIETMLPVAVYLAEWKALDEGRNPRKYRTFTSREVWTPWTFFIVYCASAVVGVLGATGLITLH